jgi:hypothetical protein
MYTTTSNDTKTNDAASAPDNDSVILSISGSESARDRHQCCICELYDWVFVSFGEGERCQRCGHAVREWCAVYERLMEQIMGA